LITETFTPPAGAPGWSREVSLSTSGLLKALKELLTDCEAPKLFDEPNVGAKQ
jgi:hypothetical protein